MKLIEIKNINIVNYNESFFGTVVIKNKIISKIIKLSPILNEKADYLIPGFIDTHTHGGYNFEFNDGYKKNAKQWQLFKSKLIQEGVTSFALTTITTNLDKIYEIAKWYGQNNDDSITAWHLEGPFISKTKKGAHPEQLIITLTQEIITKIIEYINNKKILITFAPEQDYNSIIMQKYAKNNVFGSLGHSDASYFQAINTLNKNINRFTHIFNAMASYQHRNPTIANAFFENNKSYVELIADGYHIDNIVLKQIYNLIDINRIILVSDSSLIKGLEDGFYQFGDVEIEKKANLGYLKNSNTIACSCFKYIDIVKNFYQVTKCLLNDIVRVTSYNAAQSLKIKNKGLIKVNAIADLLIVDHKLNIKAIYKNGNLIK